MTWVGPFLIGDNAYDLNLDPFKEWGRSVRESLYSFGTPGGWCAPSEIIYSDQVVSDGRDAYAVDCWMCGALVEVEQFRVRNMMGEEIINNLIGRCDRCYASVNPPEPEDIERWVNGRLEKMGSLGWYWWME